MDKYPGFETYRALYARYYNGRDLSELLRLVEPLAGAKVLDLCGGDGRLTSRILAAGAHDVILVDAEVAMVPPEILQNNKVQVVTMDVTAALLSFDKQGLMFDRAVCQQAVNYWLNTKTVWALHTVLEAGGIFAFNTFNQMPPERPRVLEYDLDGHRFVEVSWLTRRDVHHLQIREGLAPHHTVFRWLPPEHLHLLLDPYFAVTEERQGKTSLYTCRKR